MKIIKPKISNYEEKTFESGPIITGVFKAETKTINAQDLNLDECIFEKCYFLDSNISKSEFVDIIFRNCDLSNTNLENSVFRRAVFQECKLVGIDFANSNFNNVSFIDCKLNYSNFSNSKLKNLEFINCNLENASLNNCFLSEIIFDEVNLTQTEFLDTPLKDIDVTTSIIKNISVRNKDLKGLIVNAEQAMYLALCLGIIIKDR